jgi:hypothetical protein
MLVCFFSLSHTLLLTPDTSWRVWISPDLRIPSFADSLFIVADICLNRWGAKLKILRPILNFAPRGKLWPPGAIFPLGVKLSPGGGNSLFAPPFSQTVECSPLGVNEGVNIPPRGQSSPLRGQVHPWGAKFTPEGPSSPLGGQVHPWGAKFTPGGPSSPLGGQVHPWGPISPLGGQVHPWGAKFTPRGQVHPWGPEIKLRMALSHVHFLDF